MTRVLIADDHEVVRRGIRFILEGNPNIAVIGEASNGEEAVERTLELQPDLIIMDVGMPILNGLTAAAVIKKRRPQISIVLFTMYESEGMSQIARDMGLNGFVTKTEGRNGLLSAVDAVQHGKNSFRN